MTRLYSHSVCYNQSVPNASEILEPDPQQAAVVATSPFNRKKPETGPGLSSTYFIGSK